jgi:hypothetical protein
MKTLYLAWQDPKNRRWYPVGRLTFDNNLYKFVYTKGAKESKQFMPFGMMNNFEAVYESEELFPLFANRLLSKSRPEYKDYLKWLKLNEKENDPLVMLAISGGVRGTDSLEVFPCPLRSMDDKYEILFFNHGLSHLPDYVIDRVNELKQGERLFLMSDVQNPFDSLAMALRTDDPATIIGYCPRYLAEDFKTILEKCGQEIPKVMVEQVNMDAPLQLRLMCKFTSPWPESFQACANEYYNTLA